MEKNKYYTPDIKEFRVGFEFETRVASFEEKWTKDKLYAEFKDGWNSNVDETLAAYEDGYLEFRVKLLDKEDIESFGFIDGVLRDYELRYYDYPRCYCQIYYIPDSRCIFDGIIKNKSELEVVLKQIGVIQ